MRERGPTSDDFGIRPCDAIYRMQRMIEISGETQIGIDLLKFRSTFGSTRFYYYCVKCEYFDRCMTCFPQARDHDFTSAQ
jgi:hypothetical protein